jgi:hypothetical protein
MSEKNPYASDTPEWQLWENMTGCLQTMRAYMADAERYTKMAADQREKAARFQVALKKLSS